ncbi:MAG: LytTR family DNA-binding domain-containing protein [Pseudomonadota bacterium]
MFAGSKRRFANGMGDFVSDTSLSYTLREAHDLARRRRFWIVLASVIAILAMIGPFDTYGTLSLGERSLYWAVAATGSFWLGFVTSMVVASTLERFAIPDLMAVILGGLVAGLPIAVLNAGLNSLVFNAAFGSEALSVLPYASAIAIIIAVLFEIVDSQGDGSRDWQGQASSQTSALAVSPVLFDRLPSELGRDIVHVQAQDHYIQVRTMQGATLVLGSLSEAERDLASLGARVHRSWWVSRDHMSHLTSGSGGLKLVTSLGDEIPVGRTYRQTVRALFRDHAANAGTA